MAPVLLPPVTKYSLALMLVLSSAGLFLRYYAYLSLLHHYHNDDDNNDNGSGEVRHIPVPSEIFVPGLTMLVGYDSGFWNIVKHPWIIITSPFVESGIFSLFLSAATLAYGGRYCEHVWGSAELARFLAIIAFIPTLLTYLVYSFLTTIGLVGSPQPDDIFHTKEVHVICGASSIVCGFLVAFKQHVPQHVVLLFGGRIRARVQRLPLIFLCIYTFLAAFGYDPAAVSAWLGFLVSWAYLRFLRITYADPVLPFARSSLRSRSSRFLRNQQHHLQQTQHQLYSSPDSSTDNLLLMGGGPRNGGGIKIRGDACDGFAFYTFFPEPFSYPIEKLASSIHNILVSLNIWVPFTQSEVDAANAGAASRYARASSYPLQQRQPQLHQGLSGLSSPSHQQSLQAQVQSSASLNQLGQSGSETKGAMRAEIERRRSLALRALDQELTLPNPVQLPER